MIAVLTDPQRSMLQSSLYGHDGRQQLPHWETSGFGVDLRGAGDWSVARSLVRKELGWIEGGRPNGSELPGLFFANADGLAEVAEPDCHDREKEF